MVFFASDRVYYRHIAMEKEPKTLPDIRPEETLVSAVARRHTFIGALFISVIVLVDVVMDELGLGRYFLVVVLIIGVVVMRYVALQTANTTAAEHRSRRLYTLFRLLNSMLRHDVAGKLTNIRYGIETSGITDNEGITMAYDAAGGGMELAQQTKVIEQLAESNASLTPQDVRSVLDEIVDDEHFSVRIDGNASVLADVGIHSLFENLIRNAKRHSGADRMTVSIADDGDMVRISFIDEGKGIPQEFRGKLFTEGHKFGETGNTGLGLYIVRELAERYGGSVEFRPTKPHGSTFIVRLKKA